MRKEERFINFVQIVAIADDKNGGIFQRNLQNIGLSGIIQNVLTFPNNSYNEIKLGQIVSYQGGSQ